jgi:hypothetical protein
MEDYADRVLLRVEKLVRDLHLGQRYAILRDAAEVAVRVFLDSAHYAGLADVKGFLRRPGLTKAQVQQRKPTLRSRTLISARRLKWFQSLAGCNLR